MTKHRVMEKTSHDGRLLEDTQGEVLIWNNYMNMFPELRDSWIPFFLDGRIV